MIESAAVLIREHGARATSLDRVLAHSGAPRGSLYHHFPGGRAQLLDESTAYAARHVERLIETMSAAPEPMTTIDAFLAMWRRQLVESDFRHGCPVLAVAVEHDETAPETLATAGAAFEAWRARLAEVLVTHGVDPARARRLAGLVIASVEGAVVMCRAERSIAPLDDVGRELRDLLAARLTVEPA